MGILPDWFSAAATSMEINVSPTELFGSGPNVQPNGQGSASFLRIMSIGGTNLALMGSGFETE